MADRTNLLDAVKQSNDHAELINNNIVIENRTSVEHNNAVRTICRIAENHIINNGGQYRVFSENVALHFENDRNYLLPDVMIVCKPESIQSDGVHAAPDFIAEIASEATKVRDFFDKLIIYKEMGVREYWVVDLQRQFINVYLAENGFVPTPYIKPSSLDIHILGINVDTSSFWI